MPKERVGMSGEAVLKFLKMVKKGHVFLNFVIILVLPILFSLNSTAGRVYTAIYSGESTEVSGAITTNTTWTLAGSPYIVTGDVIVLIDVFLTIEPGVVLKFASGTNLTIDGSLIAQGNSTHKITFTSNSTVPSLGDWGGIKTRTGGHQKISWSKIEYSSEGLHGNCEVSKCIFDKNEAGVSGSNIDVAESNFTRNTAGIAGSWPTDGNITGCLFEENDVGAFGVNLNIADCSFTRNLEAVGGGLGEWAGIMQDCLIYNNTGGISVGGFGHVNQILNCQVRDNDGVGIYVREEAQPLIRDTNVTHNGGGGITGVYGFSTVVGCLVSHNGGNGISAGCEIYNSTVIYNGGDGVAMLRGTMSHCNLSHNGGGGVYAQNPDGASQRTIEYSEISNNLFGIEIDCGWLGMSTHVSVSNCHICNNPQGGILASPFTYRGGEVRVFNSIVDSNGKFGIRMNSTFSSEGYEEERALPIPEIVNSTISNHSIGVLGAVGVVLNSTIKDNSEIGLDVFDYYSTTSICWNNIYGNGLYNIRNHVLFGTNVNATYNWWGTTNETLIEELIHDYYDNYTLSRVLYKPYLNEPWPPSPPTPPVGGIYIPVNKLELLAPYIELIMLLAVAVVTVVYVKKRKRNTRIIS